MSNVSSQVETLISQLERNQEKSHHKSCVATLPRSEPFQRFLGYASNKKCCLIPLSLFLIPICFFDPLLFFAGKDSSERWVSFSIGGLFWFPGLYITFSWQTRDCLQHINAYCLVLATPYLHLSSARKVVWWIKQKTQETKRNNNFNKKQQRQQQQQQQQQQQTTTTNNKQQQQTTTTTTNNKILGLSISGSHSPKCFSLSSKMVGNLSGQQKSQVNFISLRSGEPLWGSLVTFHPSSCRCFKFVWVLLHGSLLPVRK